MEVVDDDDFGDLYADVEMQATSAISAIQALNGLSSSDTEIAAEDSDSLDVNEGVVSANGANVAEEKEENENNGQLNVTESGSDSEDDFDILLNDDSAKDSNNREKPSCNAELSSGNWINQEENIDELENYFGVGGKGGLTNGGHSPLHKYGKSPSAKHSSYLEINTSIGVPAYSSALNRGDREDDSFTRSFSTRSTVNQNRHYFSLPRSRSILDINIDAFDYKPWRHPGADLTDYFNFGLNEDSWKRYCNNLILSMQHQEIDSQHAASVTMAVPEKAAKSKQERTASPADENFPAEQSREMPKGRPIEVQDGKERLPSADAMYPIERDSDVIIQIPVQNIQDNCLIVNKVPFDQSANCPHEASVNEVASGAVEDLRNFSSDGEDKSMKMEGLAGGTGKPVSGRCLRMTSGRDTYPVSMDPDKNVCLMLPDPDEQFQLTDTDSDGMPEVEGNFQEPKKTVGRCRETAASQSRKKLESCHGKLRRSNSSSSPSETSKCGVRAWSGEYEDHPKRAFTNSDSGFRNALKVDLHPEKDFRKSGISSRSIGENKYFGRRNNFKFHERKHSRMSVHLDDESASYMSGGEFYDKHDYKRRSPVGHDKQRSRMHPYVFDREKNDFYDELPKYSSNREKERLFNCPPEIPYDACPRERVHRDFDFDGDQGQSLIPKGKQHLLEHISVMCGEGMEWELHQREREFFAQEMDILESTRVNELITESSQIFDDKFFTQRKRKAEEDYLYRRTGTGGFISEHGYPDDFTRDENRSIPCYERVVDHRETKYARHLPYDRRDYAKSLVMDERKHDGLLNGDETFCPATYDETRSRCTRAGLSLNTYKEHQNTSWGNGMSATSPRDDVFQRYGRTEHCGDSNALVNCSDDFEYDMITENVIFMDEFPKRVQYQKSEVLSWDIMDYNSDIPYDCLQADMTPLSDRRTYPVIGSCKKRAKMPGSCGREKLVNGRELDSRRYRLSKEDENHKQFDQNPNMITRENFRQMFPRCWGSSDSLMAVGDRKSSRPFEAESLTSLSGFEFLDSNDYPQKRKSKDLHKSRLPRIHETDNCRDDANRGRKFPAAQRSDYLDIEEGQIVAEDLAQKPITVKKRPPARKTVDQETTITENPRIKELLEKMERRRERFNCPSATKSGSEKATSLVNANAAAADANVQRPSRKRRWVGN